MNKKELSKVQKKLRKRLAGVINRMSEELSPKDVVAVFNVMQAEQHYTVALSAYHAMNLGKTITFHENGSVSIIKNEVVGNE